MAVAVTPSRIFSSAVVAVTPSIRLSSVAVAVTPSRIFSSAAVEVTAVPAIAKSPAAAMLISPDPFGVSVIPTFVSLPVAVSMMLFPVAALVKSR